jgi:hypothetical protein
MPDHSMPRLIGNLERVGEGSYRAQATSPTTGVWQVLVNVPDGTVKTTIERSS